LFSIRAFYAPFLFKRSSDALQRTNCYEPFRQTNYGSFQITVNAFVPNLSRWW